MFASGSADMFQHTQRLMALVVDAIKKLDNPVAIKGHTDSTPYSNSEGYSNWELSTDRANSSRRALLAAGLPASRIASVVGRADRAILATQSPHIHRAAAPGGRERDTALSVGQLACCEPNRSLHRSRCTA